MPTKNYTHSHRAREKDKTLKKSSLKMKTCRRSFSYLCLKFMNENAIEDSIGRWLIIIMKFESVPIIMQKIAN